MTPAARVQAAIGLLDLVLAGTPAEQALTGWARRSRFAGSGDRAMVRDHVFRALRRKRSQAVLGGAMSGRGLMLGALRADNLDPDTIFNGVGHAPARLNAAERAGGRDPETDAERHDLSDWLWDRFRDSLGDGAGVAAEALRHRAPVFLRVNLARTTRAEALTALQSDGIGARAHPASPGALEITEGARRLRLGKAYADGLVELQDAASQAVVDELPLAPGMRVLDYCAGGGGKTLAMAARSAVVFAHDAAPERMRDLPARAARAGVEVTLLDGPAVADAAPFDLVLCDVPCSGSGAWRRAPEGKWRLTPQRLDELNALQDRILDRAAGLVTPGGVLAYATCSVLSSENGDRVDAFLARHRDWRAVSQRRWPLGQGPYGFHAAHLRRD